MVDRSHDKIVAGWRAQFAALARRHQQVINAAAADGRGGEGAAIRRKMKDLERAIKAYSEKRQGEFRRPSER